jgi:hypothetical protein
MVEECSFAILLYCYLFCMALLVLTDKNRVSLLILRLESTV